MINNHYDVAVIGSGPGGLAAANAAKENGAKKVIIIERDNEPGGILLQCIHNGFGVEIFKQDLPGPSYAQKFINDANSLGVDFLFDTMVIDITPDLHVFATNSNDGIIDIQARSIVMAMGCRERTRSQIRIPGDRPAGVYSAGTAQRWVNVEGFMPGKQFVILGSGDIGMIMARRLTFEGGKVETVLEIMPYLTGLMRNYVQCLLDCDIPLKLRHTVKKIIGKNRVEAIESVLVDENFKPVTGSEVIIPCDTLLLSVGLIPENELSRKAGIIIDSVTGGPIVDEQFQTNIPGIFSAGNVVHVYDLVDWVTEAGRLAGKAASHFIYSSMNADINYLTITVGENIRYVVPQKINKISLSQGKIRFQMRVMRPIESPVWIEARDENNLIIRRAAPYARPGEMLSLEIPTQEFDTIQKINELKFAIVKR